MMKIGLIREGKNPPDRRAPLTPAQAYALTQATWASGPVEVYVQPSPIRCFADAEYAALGLPLTEDLSHCDVLLGIKEVPVDQLIPEKIYLFFSHTIKKQPHNQALLQAVLDRGIRLVDYETLTDEAGARILAFGHYAGLVGAYNGLWAYGQRYGHFDLPRAHHLKDRHALFELVKNLELPPFKIALTGGGRVAKGALQLLEALGIHRVEPAEYLRQTPAGRPVYTQLNSHHYHRHRHGKPFVAEEFYRRPADFTGEFWPFAQATHLLLAAAYWHPEAPVLFTKAQMRHPQFGIRVIADITCDIEGSIPSTVRASKIAEPVYDYNPHAEREEPPFSREHNVTVMAIDNLPGELPRDASEDFGHVLVTKVLPQLAHDATGLIARATIAQSGQLRPRFAYLHGYVRPPAHPVAAS
ncbi:MAG: NAD(P)-dependent oxidoreductase [Bernardetiaceae bacterium]|jgi:alanine dehydrogenase|nr:NAD(P)-dependent oxidoreductase [Bernardetiaceae bacterium]